MTTSIIKTNNMGLTKKKRSPSSQRKSLTNEIRRNAYKVKADIKRSIKKIQNDIRKSRMQYNKNIQKSIRKSIKTSKIKSRTRRMKRSKEQSSAHWY